MIGLREDRQERARLVGNINALFPVWQRAVVMNGAGYDEPARHTESIHHNKWAHYRPATPSLRPVAGSAASKAAG